MRSGVGEGGDITLFCISVHCVSKQADGVTTATVPFSSPQVVVKLAPSPVCNCDLEDQTAEHILQRCPLLHTARTNVWPTAVQLHTKLYGSKDEVEKTATFILH